jgi:hypothetical protein
LSRDPKAASHTSSETSLPIVTNSTPKSLMRETT